MKVQNYWHRITPVLSTSPSARVAITYKKVQVKIVSNGQRDMKLAFCELIYCHNKANGGKHDRNDERGDRYRAILYATTLAMKD